MPNNIKATITYIHKNKKLCDEKDEVFHHMISEYHNRAQKEYKSRKVVHWESRKRQKFYNIPNGICTNPS